MIEIILNAETGEITERPYSAEEIAQSENELARIADELKAKEEKEIARLAVLQKLGLSEEDLKALFG